MRSGTAYSRSRAIRASTAACLHDRGPIRPAADVARGVEALRAGSHDGVIALGGGSGLDAAKAVAFMAGQTRPLWDFEDKGDNWRRAEPRGSSGGRGADHRWHRLRGRPGGGRSPGRRTHDKCIVFHPRMLPGQVIADPELTLGLPRALTVWTGFDALSHNLEALCAPGFHPLADGIATEGIRLIHEWFRAAVRDGADLAARAYMLAAASMGAVAFQKGLGAMHALAHPIGGLLDSHHGLTIAIVMPYVLARNQRASRTVLPSSSGRSGSRREASSPGSAHSARNSRSRHPHRSRHDRGTHRRSSRRGRAADPSAAGNPLPLDEATTRSSIARRSAAERRRSACPRWLAAA